MKLVFHDRFLDHRQRDEDHPERPERLIAIRDRLEDEGLWTNILQPEPAALEDILRIHHPNYLKTLGRMGEGVWDRDTYVRPATLEIATLAAGAGLLAAETAWTGRETAWALIRPPGHHATAASAMGFCYLNSLGIAAARHVALGRGRVAIVDVDVHHGNGTQEAFYNTGDVLVISAHESPLFPGTGATDETGEGSGAGFNINVPLPYGSGDATYRKFMDMIVQPALRRFRPSIILVSFGTDIHYLDPLAGLALSSQGCVGLVAGIQSLAAELCEGRAAFFLEGGYHLGSLSEVIAAAVGNGSGRKVKLEFTDVKDASGAAAGTIEYVAHRIGQGILVPKA